MDCQQVNADRYKGPDQLRHGGGYSIAHHGNILTLVVPVVALLYTVIVEANAHYLNDSVMLHCLFPSNLTFSKFLFLQFLALAYKHQKRLEIEKK